MKKKPSPKVSQFLSLTDILNEAAFTGEHRDPVNPREPNQAFRQEIKGIVNDIFKRELGTIELAAMYERELIKRDGEIMKLEMLREIDASFAERLKRMESDLGRVYKTLTGSDAHEQASKDLMRMIETLREEAEKIKSEQAASFEELRKEYESNLEGKLDDFFKPAGNGPNSGPKP